MDPMGPLSEILIKNQEILQESLGSWLKLATSSPRHASLLAGKSSGTSTPLDSLE
jgi:hypothetical protein